MKYKFLDRVFVYLFLSVSCLFNVANAGLITDQVNDSHITVGLCNLECAWIQEVVVGVDGTLDNVSVQFSHTGSFDFFLNIGSIFDRNTPDYSISNLSNIAGYTDINVSTLNLYFTAGNTFTFGIVNSTTMFPGTNNTYRGGLVIARPGGGGYNYSDFYDLHFRTTMLVNDVPEPSTLAIFALGMMGLASRRLPKQ